MLFTSKRELVPILLTGVQKPQLHPNFHISVKNREDRTGGGVMILVKKTYASKNEILDLPTPSFPSWCKEEYKKQFIEVLIVKIQFIATA